MNGTTKFLIGAGITALMAMASHSALGLGEAFVGKLETEANAKLAAIGPGLTAQAIRETSIDRVILLSGELPAGKTKDQVIAEIAAIPGVKRAEWIETATAEPATATPPAEAPATAEAVKDCQADVDAIIKGKTIQFDSGAATLKAESLPLIEALAKELAQCSGTTVAVAGHTDASGLAANNQRLSETRAKTVVAELVNRGIPAARLVPSGYGATKPLEPGDSPAAKAANRRIEFSVAAAAAPAAAPAQ
ncbi:MAG: OmpA family protein [Sphingopyxis sp.]|nr:OmpA family protein [Sphingopyxis sp.]